MPQRSRRPFILLCLFAALSFAVPFSVDAAAENAGNVIAARRQAWAERGPQTDPLASKSPVFTGDTLATNPIGRLQVLFRDDSVLMMAPDTRTTVTEYVYGDGKKPAFGLRLAQGVTRLISGRITEADPEAMRVETAQAVVGIKGTDVQIAASGVETKVALIHGTGKAVEVYSKVHNSTFSLTEPGTSLTFTQGDTAPPAPTREPAESFSESPLPLGDGGTDTAASDSQQDSQQAGADSGQDSSTADAGSGSPGSPGASGASGAEGDSQTGPASVADSQSGSQSSTITDTVVVDTASNQDIAQPDTPVTPVTPPPAPAPVFSGTYQGSLAGTVSGSQVGGSFTMGIRDIADTPMVSGVSLYVSSDAASGARTLGSGATQELSIYGQGDIAALNSDGTFAFRSDKDSLARLAANNLLPGGYVDVAGVTDGDGISLDLTGNLGEDGADVGITGDGPKTSGLPPDMLPQVPSISPSFNGRYSGALSGTVGGTRVSGNIHMGIRNLATAPTVSAVSAYVSERGWASGASNALSIYGEGSIATLNNDGSFSFTSTSQSQARLDATNMTDNASVTVNGTANGNAVTVGMAGSLDGNAADVSLSGTDIPKTSATAPGLADLPAPPVISPSFSGRYSGNIAGTVAGTQVSGQFHMGVRDLATAPTVSAVSAYVSEKGWAANASKALSIYGSGTIATLGADGKFTFISTASSAAQLTATGQTAAGRVTVNGTVSGRDALISAVGSLDGSNQNIDFTGDLSKMGSTTPGLADLPAPPSVRPAFNGRYSGSLAGAVGGTAVTGNFHLGIKDLANAPTVSAVSIFASERGWASDARKPLSIYGEGTIATLNANGEFSFNANDSTAARLIGGTATVTGQTDGSGLNLGIIGHLGGTGMLANVSGGGSLKSTTPPALGDLPAPPSIATRFNGRYTGNLGGNIDGTAVTGQFHMGIKNLAETPMVSAVSLYASEVGWSSGATQALSVHGEGNLATLNSHGEFEFKADAWNTPATLDAHGLKAYQEFYSADSSSAYQGGSVTVSGTATGDGINLGLIGSLDGTVSNIALNGDASLVATAPPALSDLPVPPAFSTGVHGIYRGATTGLYNGMSYSGMFTAAVNGLTQNPYVSRLFISMPGNGGMGGNFVNYPIDASGNFNATFVQFPHEPSKNLVVNGHVDSNAMDINWNGYASQDRPWSGSGSGPKVSNATSP